MSKDFGPSLTAAKLYERTSKSGNVYISGRLGSLRLTLLKSRETGADGEPMWELKLSEAGPYQPRKDNEGDADVSSRSAPARADWQRPPGAEKPRAQHAGQTADPGHAAITLPQGSRR